MFRESVINLYSQVIEPVGYVQGREVSFNGSQIQDEFFKAWECIDTYYNSTKRGHISFLEIGAYKGLWALALAVYCTEKGTSFQYTTVTYMEQDPNNNPLYNVQEYYQSIGAPFTLINSPSQDIRVLEQLPLDKYSIVFIDGDHSSNNNSIFNEAHASNMPNISDDMGGNDFGIADNSSWDDSSSGSDDWS